MTQTTNRPEKTSDRRLILRHLYGVRRYFFGALLFSVLYTALGTLTPQIIKIAVDSFIGGAPLALPKGMTGLLGLAPFLGSPRALLIWAAVAVLAISLLSGASTYFSRMGLAKGSEGFVKSLRDELYGHIQKLPFSWHVRHQTGEIIQRCTSDLDVVRNFVCNQLVEVFRTGMLLVISMVIMFSMNVKLSLMVLLFIPIVIAYSALFYSKIAKRFRTADEAEGELAAVVQENLTGVRVVRAFGRERFEIERFDKKNERFSNLWIRLGSLLSAYWGIGDFITGMQILSVIAVGTLFAVQGQITLGEFLAFVSYNATLAWPVRGLGRILSEMSKAGVSIQRVAYILNAREERDSPKALTPPMNGDIVFSNVSFSYEGEAEIVKDVSFTIPAGKTFAILGGTGSGKSTLMHLLDRLYDLPEGCGRITIGGVDIRDIRRAYLRENIGLVLQEPFLFSRTIGENIGATRPQADITEIRHAAGIACVDEAIAEFSAGYDTIVGERGVTLSGGQKQRVAIARMLLQKAPIMVFDDSLSAVDAETDSKIRAALLENLGGSTVILISHRITTLMQADCILVLENGRVAGQGTHEALIGQKGVYRQIYDIQMNSDDRALLDSTKGGDSNGL